MVDRRLLRPLATARAVALALVVVGFVGAVASDASPLAADTGYSLAFYAGIALGVLSVYLGIYGAGRE